MLVFKTVVSVSVCLSAWLCVWFYFLYVCLKCWLLWWQFGLVVTGNVVGHINKVALHRAGLVLRWVTVHKIPRWLTRP